MWKICINTGHLEKISAVELLIKSSAAVHCVRKEEENVNRLQQLTVEGFFILNK